MTDFRLGKTNITNITNLTGNVTNVTLLIQTEQIIMI